MPTTQTLGTKKPREEPKSRSRPGALLSPPRSSWLSPGPPGSSEVFLAPAGSSWLLLLVLGPLDSPGFSRVLVGAPGSFWLLLTLVGFSWLLLAPPGSSWFLKWRRVLSLASLSTAPEKLKGNAGPGEASQILERPSRGLAPGVSPQAMHGLAPKSTGLLIAPEYTREDGSLPPLNPQEKLCWSFPAPLELRRITLKSSVSKKEAAKNSCGTFTASFFYNCDSCLALRKKSGASLQRHEKNAFVSGFEMLAVMPSFTSAATARHVRHRKLAAMPRLQVESLIDCVLLLQDVDVKHK
jgi:hypothetical protein